MVRSKNASRVNRPQSQCSWLVSWSEDRAGFHLPMSGASSASTSLMVTASREGTDGNTITSQATWQTGLTKGQTRSCTRCHVVFSCDWSRVICRTHTAVGFGFLCKNLHWAMTVSVATVLARDTSGVVTVGESASFVGIGWPSGDFQLRCD